MDFNNDNVLCFFVRISKHFKNMRTLLGEKEEQIDHITRGGLWSRGHAAPIQFCDPLCQTYGGAMGLWSLLSLSFSSSQCALHLNVFMK